MNKHLIVKAVHRDKSFLSQAVEKLERKLKSKDEVQVRDLYTLNFNPVLTINDFEALRSGALKRDIVREQDYIINSDYLWIVFPIWWTNMPAILKGYIDRVFLSGFAYRMKGDTPVGLLTDKKVIILNSMGMSRQEYEETGMFKAIELTIDKGIFEFSGMSVIDHRYFTSIMSADMEQRNKYFMEIENLADLVLWRNNKNKQTINNKTLITVR
ncbi:MAG: NAD(P)H-dependent oxidoreductase [Bacteroidales bacterium]|nr:NAD(P)H-dependent oxidoreductase [Bacteroidales bacterium]